ncbi:MAG: class I SAM-dependent methyltransferase [Trueperaceae bacterium]
MSPDLYDDPEFYDLLNAGYRDDLAFYRGLADDHGGPVLELGAGSGRVTVALAQAGHAVVAVEPSPAMRARGAARLAAAGCGERVTWVDADMRALDLAVSVPLVIAPFHALMHLPTLDDQDAALRAARRHLGAGGAFATDVYVPRFACAGAAGAAGGPSAVRAERLGDGDLFVWQIHDAAHQVVVTEHRWDRVADDGTLLRRRATLRQRYFHRFELERALRAAGFTRVRTFGGFGRAPVTEAATSWVFLAYA